MDSDGQEHVGKPWRETGPFLETQMMALALLSDSSQYMCGRKWNKLVPILVLVLAVNF